MSHHLCHVHVRVHVVTLLLDFDDDPSLFQQRYQLLHVCQDPLVRMLLTFV